MRVGITHRMDEREERGKNSRQEGWGEKGGVSQEQCFGELSQPGLREQRRGHPPREQREACFLIS